MTALPSHLLNLLGAIVAVSINGLLIALFVARLYHKPDLEYWLGVLILVHLVPLTYLLMTGAGSDRPTLYSVQIGLMIVFLIVEGLLDYVFQVEFRQIRWMVILYVTLFFGATGGMIGVATHAGKLWMYLAIVSFIFMGVLSVYQRIVTGQ